MDLPLGHVWNDAAVWADLDNDGDLDLLCPGSPSTPSGPPLLRLLRNEGAGRLVEVATDLPGAANGGLLVADYNRDGRLDIGLYGVIQDASGLHNYGTRLFRNEGDLRFALAASGWTGFEPGPFRLGDGDRDGDLDLLFANGALAADGISKTLVFRNDGTGAFLPDSSFSADFTWVVGKWLDVDSDGESDLALLLGGQEGKPSPLYRRNLRDSTFRGVGAEYPAQSSTPIVWVDLDGNGRTDAVVKVADNRSAVLFADGRGGFVTPPKTLVDVAAGVPAFADADNDGDYDMLLPAVNFGDESRLYWNDGSGTFAPSEVALKQTAPRLATWADFDGDGDLDVVVTGYCGQEPCIGTRLFRNDGTSPNTPPAAPDGLSSSTVSDGDVRLAWSAPVDARTTNATLLTYDVRVGTAPGRGDVAMPPADLATGTRRIAEEGAERAPFRLLRGLPKGTYYWSVQAVDTAQAGSAWATDGRFTITNTPPVIAPISPRTVAPSTTDSVVFAIDDAETPPDRLVARAESSDEGFIPASNLSVAGTGKSRTLTFRPAPGAQGTVRVTLVVTDDGGLATRRSFEITVLPFAQVPLLLPRIEALAILPVPPADWDGDGDLDLVVTGQRTRDDGSNVPVQVLALNSGGKDALSFVPGAEVPYFGRGSIADFDRDGDLDYIANGFLSRNRGNGTFDLVDLAIRYGDSFPADIDGDGAPDLVVRGSDPNQAGFEFLRIYRNQGGAFVPLEPDLDSARPWLFHVADWDLDGDPDILNGNHGESFPLSASFAKLFLNQGDGLFRKPATEVFGIASVFLGMTWVTDDDDDGDPDIVVRKFTDVGEHEYYRHENTGAGTFAFSRVPRRDNQIVVDYNHDGITDTVESVQEDTFGPQPWYVFRRGTDGTRTRQPVRFLETPMFADLDGDGDLDFVGSNDMTNAAKTGVTRNLLVSHRSDVVNQPPSAPGAPTAVAETGDRIRFSWNPASDDHTPAHLVTYELRVGTTPGGFDVVSPSPAVASTVGRTPATRRVLHHIPPGTLYWSVRAVDGQFRAGAWAPEQTFRFDSPTLSQIPDVVTPPSIPSRPIPFVVAGDSSTPAADVKLSVETDNPSVLPPSAITFAGAGAERTAILQTGPTNGVVHVTILATTARGTTASVRFRVTVAWFATEELDRANHLRGGWSAADWDHDGDLDLLGGTAPYSTDLPKLLLRNPGDARFVPAPDPLPGDNRDIFVPGDWDGDGRLEVLGIPRPVAFGDPTPTPPRLWAPDANLAFTPVFPGITNLAEVRQTADADRDSIVDLMLWGRGQDTSQRQAWSISAFARSGWVPDGIPTERVVGMGWGDFDADGDTDVVVSFHEPGVGFEAGPVVNRLYRYDFPWGFVPVDVGLPQDFAYRIHVHDFDQDGRLDLWLGVEAPAAVPSEFVGQAPRLFRNTREGSFVEVPTAFPPLFTAPPAWGDFDNDGDYDLLLVTDAVGANEPRTLRRSQLWRNDGNQGFAAFDAGFPPTQANAAVWGDFDADGDLDLALAGYAETSPFGVWLLRNASTVSNAPPAVPSGLTVGFTAAGPRLAWNAAKDTDTPGLVTYNLRVGRRPGAADVVAAQADPVTGRRRVSGTGNVGPLRLRQLGDLPDGTYYWSVQAVDAAYAASAFAAEQSFVLSRPTLAVPSRVVIRANTNSPPFELSVADAETPADALRVTFESSNPALLPVERISLTGNGTRRELRFDPVPARAGSAKVWATVHDGDGQARSIPFEVTVLGDLHRMESDLPAFAEGDASWGDADRDGDLDLLLGGATLSEELGENSTTAIFENQNGHLLSRTLGGFGTSENGAARWVDANRDGRLDVFVTGSRDTLQRAGLYYAQPDGTWLEIPQPTRVFGDLVDSDADWADADGDGDPDLLHVGGLDTNRADGRLITNLGESRFEWARASSIPVAIDGSVSWTDFDGDGDNDFVVAGRSEYGAGNPFALLYLNQGNRFDFVDSGLPGITRGKMAVADFDRDGHPDILVTGEGTNGPLTQLMRNDGTGRFSTVTTSLPALRDADAAWADADGDGRPDLALAGVAVAATGAVTATSGVWFNRAEGFERATVDAPGLISPAIAWGDVDGDGRIDLLMSGRTDRSNRTKRFTAVHRNEGSFPVSTPPVPVGLSVQTTGDDTVFRWSLPTGSPTGLSFNLRVGTAPGLDDIVGANADLDTGKLRLAQPGNAGMSGQWRLRYLAKRTYYWSVQSVDAAYRGSAFAPEAVHAAANAAPTVGSIPNQSAPINQAVGPLTFSLADRDGDPSAVTVVAESSRPDILASGNIVVSGSGTTRSLTLTPNPDAVGPVTITLTLRDALGASVQTRFVVDFVALVATPLMALRFEPVALAPADFDRDGDPDLLVGSLRPGGTSTGQYRTDVYENAGADPFGAPVVTNLPVRDPRPSWGDVDGDGDLDLFTASTLLRNDRGTFVATPSG
ncbi:MAG: VCBS repeat-containing protein, partial [Verrucomicrobiales bacterium]|nr:VCBS repeat-containing protein [Verrucomicrobiales bacterium]